MDSRKPSNPSPEPSTGAPSTKTRKSGRRKAAALRYRSGEDSAPVVIAKGEGAIADRIMEIARDHEIPLYRDPDLISVLCTIDLGRAIPPELYEAVAEVLAFVYKINKKYDDLLRKSRQD
ncbi:MAG: EscU/YscU/HrcU family type III secretion system export apparatus switch protein [Candidatus Omnitrophica bacterium]|nr:EscU/YscU/HrcU family type III secretion system export apparatus switch protein [Candidatus Omnitrophota bacterium]